MISINTHKAGLLVAAVAMGTIVINCSPKKRETVKNTCEVENKAEFISSYVDLKVKCDAIDTSEEALDAMSMEELTATRQEIVSCLSEWNKILEDNKSFSCGFGF